MINIETVVYFDLEATWLKSAGRPRLFISNREFDTQGFEQTNLMCVSNDYHYTGSHRYNRIEQLQPD